MDATAFRPRRIQMTRAFQFEIIYFRYNIKKKLYELESRTARYAATDLDGLSLTLGVRGV